VISELGLNRWHDTELVGVQIFVNAEGRAERVRINALENVSPLALQAVVREWGAELGGGAWQPDGGGFLEHVLSAA
jgi:hypothetical protein